MLKQEVSVLNVRPAHAVAVTCPLPSFALAVEAQQIDGKMLSVEVDKCRKAMVCIIFHEGILQREKGREIYIYIYIKREER